MVQIETIVESWSTSPSGCVIDYTELSSVLVQSDDFSVGQIVDLAYFWLFFYVHCSMMFFSRLLLNYFIIVFDDFRFRF